MSTVGDTAPDVHVGSRVCIANHHDEESYVCIGAPQMLWGWVLQVHNGVARVQLDDDDVPFLIKADLLKKDGDDFSWPLEQGPRDLKDGEEVIVVNTDDASCNGLRGRVHDFDAKHGLWGVWFAAQNFDASFHLNRLRRI